MVVCIFIIDGGLPPRSWLIFVQMLVRMPANSGLFAFPFQLGLSLFWGFVWYLLGWVGLCVYRHQRQRQSLTQQIKRIAATWLPSQQISMAVSTSATGTSIPFLSVEHASAMINRDAFSTSDMTAPRLRLPQRPARGQDFDVAEVPTRPAPAADTDSTQQQNTPRFTIPLHAHNPRVLPLQVGVGWHTGLARRHFPNEDSIAVLQGTYTYQGQLLPYGLFVVADGMGGHDNGLEASQLAMQSMSHTVLQNIIMGKEMSDEFFLDMLIGGAEWANLAIYQRGQEEGSDMGTTLTAALIIDCKAYIINVGDSRTYLFRESAGLIQITHDHSLVASLVAFGQITPDEIYTHPERSKIYRSLGQGTDLKIDSFILDLQPHDRLLLCSDGLWEMIRDPVIERIVRATDNPHLLSERLVQTALRGGGADNISVVIVQV
ncbi:hypothetical protein KDI_31820 [Dictyobacter arantiisoli]|uniref:PPM-type phosphatase domain-containing protein n=2 Tax=Dictyobacter arantiisoli TaxID=2014874 RepID=A0A5A5TEF0_9CHLR|nr:hypothetical protein KDI_31820 [Dictyobacter arantiisoli]